MNSHQHRTAGTGRNGFTLVEIAIVVVIIGVLASIAIPVFSKVRDAAYEAQCRADLEMLSTAIEQLAWDTGKWPGGVTRTIDSSKEIWDLTSAEAGIFDFDNALFDEETWKGPYIHQLGNDPWGNPYFFDADYRVTGVWHCVVGSFGPNGKGRNQYDSDDLYVIVKRGDGTFSPVSVSP